MRLDQAMQDAFHRDGHLVIHRLFEPGEASEIRARISALAVGQAPLPARVARMEEPGAPRTSDAAGPLARVRKLEGVPLATDPVIRRAAHHPRLVATMQDLLGEDLKLLRAAAMLKPARIGSAKGLHQDAAYYPIEPMEHIAAWIALDPATPQNGCMEVLPGAHRDGLQAHERRAYDTDLAIAENPWSEDAILPLPMQPGDVLLTHCLTPHRSGANTSDAPRRALILAYMNAKSRYAQPTEALPPWVASLPITGRSYPGCV